MRWGGMGWDGMCFVMIMDDGGGWWVGVLGSASLYVCVWSSMV